MKKTLVSGIIVDDTTYYKLLDLKNTYPLLFDEWRRTNKVYAISINALTLLQYNDLLIFAGITT